MKSYLYLSDIHANFEVLKQLETLPEFVDENCEIRFGGDYIDGFDLKPNATLDTLHFVKNLCDSGKAKAIVGNHDVFLLDSAFRPFATNWWHMNGREETLANLGIPFASESDLREQLLFHLYDELVWLRSLPYYLEDGKNILVHAGFELDLPLDKQDTEGMVWIREFYIDSLNHLTDVDLHPDFKGKTIISGHTPTCTMGEYEHPISPCQILKGSLELDGEPLITRYFIDGGSKSGSEFSRINLLKLDSEVNELWQGYLDETGFHKYSDEGTEI